MDFPIFMGLKNDFSETMYDWKYVIVSYMFGCESNVCRDDVSIGNWNIIKTVRSVASEFLEFRMEKIAQFLFEITILLEKFGFLVGEFLERVVISSGFSSLGLSTNFVQALFDLLNAGNDLLLPRFVLLLDPHLHLKISSNFRPISLVKFILNATNNLIDPCTLYVLLHK